jgi:sugar lactone lactonase YvrE
MAFELAIDCRVVLAETPIWDPRLKKLYWTDLFEGTVHRYDPATGQDECIETHSVIGSAIPCETPGRLLVAVDDGMMLLDFDSGQLELVVAPQPNTGKFRYNDTRCDAAGRIFTSTVSKLFTEPDFDPNTMTGKFYMVDTDGTVVTLVDKLVQYNTIFVDSRNENLYAVDTYYKKLLRFDYSLEKGASGNPEVVISFDDMPDGASVDADDNVYVCHWGEKKLISVWSLKTYSLIKTIPFPVKNICCGGFAGDDLRDFYVATSKFWLPEGDPDFEAGAGGIFKTRVDVPGLPEHFYKDQSLRKTTG